MMFLGMCAAVVISGVTVANARIVCSTRRHIFSQLAELPEVETAMVLGCSPLTNNGQPNTYFEARMNAAAALFASGKVRKLVASGRPLRVERPRMESECEAMRDALIARGVPPSCILVDPAGTRTWHSVRRGHSHFGLNRLIFVSQSFHTPRAVWIARQLGLEAYGYDAASPSLASLIHLRVHIREIASRTRAAVDLLQTKKNVPGS